MKCVGSIEYEKPKLACLEARALPGWNFVEVSDQGNNLTIERIKCQRCLDKAYPKDIALQNLHKCTEFPGIRKKKGEEHKP